MNVISGSYYKILKKIKASKWSRYISAFIILAVLTLILHNALEQAPQIPHEITSASADSCRVCHEDESTGAPAVDHIKRDNCTRCHQAEEAVAYEDNNYMIKKRL